jgi:hypothetical protein
MQNATAYITFNYRDHLYTATCQLDSLDSLHDYIERETREFGLGEITFNFDGDTEHNKLLQAEVRLFVYKATEEARAYSEALDVIDSMHVHICND